MTESNHIIRAAAIGLIAFILYSAESYAQHTLWLFGKDYSPEFEESWTRDHVIPATFHGEGVLSASDAQGNPLERYEIKQNRAFAGPFETGDYFLIEVPVEKLPAGSYLDFDATFAIQDGAPMDWILEIMDGGEWTQERPYRCYGPALGSSYRYTTILETFRLENPVEGSIRFRLSAADGYVRPAKGGEDDGMATFVTAPFVGTMVKNLGDVPPADTLKILCLGNSFTYYCGSPVLLKEIAWNEGHYLDISASLKGGWTMGQHLSLGTTNDLVAEGGFDYVFLQDQSRAAAHVGKDPKGKDQLVRNIAAMAAKVRTVSPECKAVVECTWAYEKEDCGSFGSLKAFDKYGRKGARLMAKAVGNAQVSPIAKAFEIVRRERPDINLYHTDKHHQSMLGSYLKSCVNYLLIFGEPFGDSPADCLVDPETAAYLRSVAERTVL